MCCHSIVWPLFTGLTLHNSLLNMVIFYFSSQVLFSISQKLIQHQIINYTEILKWLQEILVCRNSFLQKHSSNANVGSNIPVCKQAHIKLEVRYLNCIFYASIFSLSVLKKKWHNSKSIAFRVI